MKTDIRLNRTLLCLIGVQVCINGCMAGIRMAAPLLSLRQGYSAAAVGVLLALFAFIQLFLAIPAGRYADRHSLKRLVGIGMGFSVLGAALVAVWPVFPVLCVTALLTGGATGAVVITLQRHAGRLASDPTQLKQVFSWLAIAPAIANFVGPFLAGLTIDHAGFRAAFALMALLALCSWLLVRNTPEIPLQLAVPAGAASDRSWDLLADPRMRHLLLINWVLTSCWDVHTFVLPVLGYERGLSASAIGTILGAFAIAATRRSSADADARGAPAGVGGDHLGDGRGRAHFQRLSAALLAVGDGLLLGAARTVARLGTADGDERTTSDHAAAPPG